MSTASQSRSAYDSFAAIYDRHMALDFAAHIMPVLEELLLKNLRAGARVLDLCCGSGRLTQRLVGRGFRVTGVDASEPMLRLARRHAPRAEFLLGDLRDAELAPGYAAALSTFNSLAHLHTAEDLQRALRNINSALLPGGIFVFDLSLPAQYERDWSGCYTLGNDSHACTVRPSYDAQRRLARNEISISGVSGPEATFTIFQKCHTESEITQALAESGFGRIENFDAERDLGMAGESGRCFFRSCRA